MNDKEWGDDAIDFMFIANQSSMVLAVAITLALLIFKLTGVFEGHWVWVFVPLIARFAMLFLALIFAVAVKTIGFITGKTK